jgi:hypothetical protein
MVVCGRAFTDELVSRIQARVAAEPCVSRRALSRQVCAWLEWRSPSGALSEMSCRKALGQLERQGRLSLPAARKVAGFEGKAGGGGEVLKNAKTPARMNSAKSGKRSKSRFRAMLTLINVR